MAEKHRRRGQPPQSAEEQRRILQRLERQIRRENKAKEKRLIIGIFAVVLIAAAVLIFLVTAHHRPDYDTGELLEVHYIDVGQGDCEFITCGGQTVLIDSGEDLVSESVISYLKKMGVKRLDYVVATHPHSDHMGGMYRIIDAFDVGEVIIPHLSDKDIPTTRYFERFLGSCSAKGLVLTEAEVGRIIAVGTAQAEIIAPNSLEYANVNDYSVSLLVRNGGHTFIFTGDAEELSETQIIGTGRLSHVTVYKAGHHGSYTSSSAEFMEVISPEYAVISCGADNSYGHPHASALSRIKQYTDKIYRTDECGTIVFSSDGANVEVRTER